VGQGVNYLPQSFIAGKIAGADFLDYLMKGTIIHWDQIRFDVGDEPELIRF
jgi:hypothetical protein